MVGGGGRGWADVAVPHIQEAGSKSLEGVLPQCMAILDAIPFQIMRNGGTEVGLGISAKFLLPAFDKALKTVGLTGGLKELLFIKWKFFKELYGPKVRLSTTAIAPGWHNA